MRILFLGNNWVAWQVVSWLRARGEDIVGVVPHPPDRAKYRTEILEAAQLAPDCVFDASTLRQPEVVEAIKKLRPDIGISALFGYILKPELLDLFPAGCINIHPALLPFNRGAFPNVWSIVDGTRAGATIHYIDNGIDTGDILAQKEVSVEVFDTGETLYRKLERACVDLFVDTWPAIRSGQAPRMSQLADEGSSHRVRDVEGIDEIDLDRNYTGRELINILRARTFPPYAGAFFRHHGTKIYLNLELRSEAANQEVKNGHD